VNDIDKNSTLINDVVVQSKYAMYDWYINLKTQVFECDDEARTLLIGDSESDLSARTLFQLLPKSQRLIVKQAFQSAINTNQRTYAHCCLFTSQHLFTYVEIAIDRISAHELKGTLSPCLTLPAKDDAAELFYSLFENAHHGIIVADSDTRILACNHYFETLTGYLRNELVGLRTEIFNAGEHSEAYYREMWQQVHEAGFWKGIILSRHADGKAFPHELTIHKMHAGSGQVFYVGFSSDLSTELERLEDLESGGVDILTQLPSKETFLERLHQCCLDADSRHGLVVLAIQPKFLDSSVQETKRQFASYLKDNTHVVASGYLGSDCFAVCLMVDIQMEQQVASDIGRAITKLFHSFKHAQTSVALALKDGVTGVSVWNVDAIKPNQLVSHAYQALLELHSGQTRRINFYDREIHRQVERKKQIENHVLQSLEQGKIEVYFQPIVDISRRRVDKFEALCRFPGSEEFEASTQEFVEVVEELNKVVELDDLVLLAALEQLPELQAQFGEHVSLSVNRSLRSTVELSDILQRAAMILDKQNTNPALLTLEFTESAFFKSNSHNRQLLSLLRDAGVQIAVDDFGTGCASFKYLKENYFDILKIDREFIQHLSHQTRQYEIVVALIQLAKRLDLKVVAEGVETKQELDVMYELGVEYVQGYYFSKPLPLNELSSIDDMFNYDDSKVQAAPDSIGHLAQPVPHVDPGDPLSLLYQYFSDDEVDYLPIVEDKICVGFVDRPSMNLHLTANMGTDHESNKESAYWHKPANRIMSPVVTEIEWHCPKSQVSGLVRENRPFPWCLVDEHGHFKGIVSSAAVLSYLANNNSVT